MDTPRNLSRRRFLHHSVALAAGATVGSRLVPCLEAAPAGGSDGFLSNWSNCPDRVWLGSEYWSNPLQDWRVAGGRIECTHAAADRNVHLLVRALGARPGGFDLSVNVGRVDGSALAGKGSVGFRIGIRGPLPDFRNALAYAQGLDAGLTAEGGLFIGAVAEAAPGAIELDFAEAQLRLTGQPEGDGYAIALSVSDRSGRARGTVSKTVARGQCEGNIALVNNFGIAAPVPASQPIAVRRDRLPDASGLGAFWFANWKVAGNKIDLHPERAFGPVLFSQYTLSHGVLKMSAQLPPLGAKDNHIVRLEVKSGATWRQIGEATMHPQARTVAFRVGDWESSRDVDYRLAYRLKFRDGRSEDHDWTGTVRADPVSQPRISVADISCNNQAAFPNAAFVANVARLNPDLLAFTGDQFYENTGGYGAVREPGEGAIVDYLRRWYFHGWTWRELTKDRPSVALPDDHDVYQGNLWGEAGAGRVTTQAAGGYDMPADWVNVVYRTQTVHLPDPHDPSPGKRGTLQYYCAMVYGRIGFAILADRQYKSGPEGKVPPTGGRGDQVTDPNFDPKTADVPGLSLLGDKQEAFLRDWVRDWRGTEMKAVVSQTLFTAFPTTHGNPRGVVRADYDTNGWPQTARNRAIREMRRAFAFHLAGDQHIPGLVHYGVDEHRDGPVAFAGPAINVGYPRWFEPEKAPWTKPKQEGLTGDFTDSFGHPMTVLAVKNGAAQPRQNDVMEFLEDKASGLGLVHFDKPRRKIRIDCWPFRADVSRESTQFPGWPVEVGMLDNYKRTVGGHLPPLIVAGVKQPLIEVIDEATGELLYLLRTNEPTFRPHVFAAGKYRVRVSDPETGRSAEFRQLESATTAQKAIAVRL